MRVCMHPSVCACIQACVSVRACVHASKRVCICIRNSHVNTNTYIIYLLLKEVNIIRINQSKKDDSIKNGYDILLKILQKELSGIGGQLSINRNSERSHSLFSF